MFFGLLLGEGGRFPTWIFKEKVNKANASKSTRRETYMGLRVGLRSTEYGRNNGKGLIIGSWFHYFSPTKENNEVNHTLVHTHKCQIYNTHTTHSHMLAWNPNCCSLTIAIYSYSQNKKCQVLKKNGNKQVTYHWSKQKDKKLSCFSLAASRGAPFVQCPSETI